LAKTEADTEIAVLNRRSPDVGEAATELTRVYRRLFRPAVDSGSGRLPEAADRRLPLVIHTHAETGAFLIPELHSGGVWIAPKA
jgi:hypothetical protein